MGVMGWREMDPALSVLAVRYGQIIARSVQQRRMITGFIVSPRHNQPWFSNLTSSWFMRHSPSFPPPPIPLLYVLLAFSHVASSPSVYLLCPLWLLSYSSRKSRPVQNAAKYSGKKDKPLEQIPWDEDSGGGGCFRKCVVCVTSESKFEFSGSGNVNGAWVIFEASSCVFQIEVHKRGLDI